MSLQPFHEPDCRSCASTPAIDQVIDSRPRDLGGFSVRRLLPSRARRSVGPFVFFDHMGPARLPRGSGIDVRPHPHINLATVTYLFEGAIEHRDSLGSDLTIEPGAINWMTAGRGIVHSERTPIAAREAGPALHGIQLWLALPRAHEETEPSFHHHPADTIPAPSRDGVQLRVLAGSAYGETSPVHIFSELFYVEARLPAGTELSLPDSYEERAIYLVDGDIRAGAERAQTPRMLIATPGQLVTLAAETDSHVMLLGGAPLDGERHMFWNFVSSRPERIEQAKRDWKEERFPLVPGDSEERIPLPE